MSGDRCSPVQNHSHCTSYDLEAPQNPQGTAVCDNTTNTPNSHEKTTTMSSKMWEVDPETRSKLLTISKTNSNNRCVDCGAPSPQWASPKFGIFFCLACSGIHRSLGVHISFVRSVTMDAFKTAEVKRMEYGGNKPWKDFFDSHSSNKLLGRDFDSCTIGERYDSEAGEEWKDRLTAKVDGTDYVPGSSRVVSPPKRATVESAEPTPVGSGRNTPLGNVRSAPQRNASPSQKSRNEAYFASKGSENASRPDDLPPNQGGKFSGFGSGPPPSATSNSGGGLQDDPIAALTKGFGWLSSTVTKQAATLNSTYLQPGIQSLAERDIAAQARQAALQAGTFVQQGAKGVGDSFNKFVDPEQTQDGQSRAPGGKEPAQKDFWDAFGQAPAGPPKEKKSFWDDFAAAGEERQAQVQPKPSSIGTSAMKTGGAGSAGKKDDDGWGGW